MTKVLSLETSKKLAPYLENVEAENIYRIEDKTGRTFITYWNLFDTYIGYKDYKALTLEEAVEFLPTSINGHNQEMFKMEKNQYWNEYMFCYWNFINMQWKTLLEAIEKMINQIIDNDLLKND